MKNRLHDRLAALETRLSAGARKMELWVTENDGLLHNRNGQVMTRAEFDAACPTAIKIKLNIFQDSSQS